MNRWTSYELTMLRAAYREPSGVDVTIVARTIGRSENAVTCKAEEIGITSRRGRQKRTKRAVNSVRAAHHKLWNRLQHPRGMHGKKHSAKTRGEMSRARAGKHFRSFVKMEEIGETPPA